MAMPGQARPWPGLALLLELSSSVCAQGIWLHLRGVCDPGCAPTRENPKSVPVNFTPAASGDAALPVVGLRKLRLNPEKSYPELRGTATGARIVPAVAPGGCGGCCCRGGSRLLTGLAWPGLPPTILGPVRRRLSGVA